MSEASGVRRDADVQSITERRVGGAPLPIFTHEWRGLAGVVHGVTGRGDGPEPLDMGFFGSTPVRSTMSRWRALREWSRCPSAIHAHQVHGARVVRHGAAPAGLIIADDADGHVTAHPGLLLTVSLADCVPVFIADLRRRAIAVLHSGWRGTAAGVLESGIHALAEHAGSDLADLAVHIGPAICSDCYEVGPEVHTALGLDTPHRPAPVDLRAVVAARALSRGVAADRITVSSHCTRCGDGSFFSHRGGDAGRFIAFMGIVGAGDAAAAEGRR